MRRMRIGYRGDRHPLWRRALFGGAMSGLGGAYLSLIYTPMWAEDMTAGRGWLALALVVFATWRGWRVGGGLPCSAPISSAVSPSCSSMCRPWALGIPAQFVSMLPYLATIVVLVVISTDRSKSASMPPACLGRPFHVTG